jgi:8-oxo-dGTP pyrophosphatase MutT (NUDIX family)
MDLNTGRVLVGRRAMDGEHTGTFSHFGGKVELQERPLDGALREFAEETGWCGCGGMRLEHLHTSVAPGNWMSYHHFLGIVDGMFEPALNEEHLDAVWAEVEVLFALEDVMHPVFRAMWNERCEAIIERRERLLSFAGR